MQAQQDNPIYGYGPVKVGSDSIVPPPSVHPMLLAAGVQGSGIQGGAVVNADKNMFAMPQQIQQQLGIKRKEM